MKMFSLLSIETASNSQEEAIIAQAFFSFLKWVFLDLDSAKEKSLFGGNMLLQTFVKAIFSWLSSSSHELYNDFFVVEHIFVHTAVSYKIWHNLGYLCLKACY